MWFTKHHGFENQDFTYFVPYGFLGSNPELYDESEYEHSRSDFSMNLNDSFDSDCEC